MVLKANAHPYDTNFCMATNFLAIHLNKIGIDTVASGTTRFA
jgi:hypothetical protein